ncbi:penicillin-binding transpeptidase domain-containing protein [Anaeromyxobacter paludicola]|uniref:Penicillin-binding protein n=1 Tax=Anaeromyxobacter paludicola TaxID=2918171 RepID=A0ABM7XBY2_9BACT|nr:penicillin-binding transpeptidase domain-containing protein [Anaeromyxobacter paludicola]BDG09364.1 penicillin-binding protein [Anaeromyxobacter paludicola]
MKTHRLAPWFLAASAGLFALLAFPWRQDARGATPPAPQAAVAEATAAAASPLAPTLATVAHPASPAPAAPAAQPVLGDPRWEPSLGRYVASYGPRRAVLTLDPRLQPRLEKALADARMPWGATVLLEPRTGKVLAMAERSEAGDGRGLALRPLAPAASVFKIVTSAALLERGVQPESEVCYHGGNHRIQPGLLKDSRRDGRCLSLSSALGHSANVVFAKLAGRDLEPAALRTEAGRFLFNGAIPFERPVEASPAQIPDDRFQFATTAAGFGSVRMSPLHAALIAAIVANNGLFVPPRLVDEVEGGAGPARPTPHQAVSPRVALALAEMMRTTVTEGTARRTFGKDRWRRSPLRDVLVAGKTGSLAEQQPFRDYTWFVGFAPVNDPQVAVATVIANDRLWHVRASQVAHQALEAYFALPRGTRTASR